VPYAEESVKEIIREALSFAGMMGIPSDRLRELVVEQLGAKVTSNLRIAFIECNREEAQGTARRMRRELGCPVDPFVLERLPDPDVLIEGYPIISTTLYHLPEVRTWLGSRGFEPVGLEHSPSTEAKLAIAQMNRGTRIGVIAVNERTLNVLVRLVEMYHPTISGAALVSEGAKVQRLETEAEALVVHPLAARSIAPKSRNRLIVVDFQIQHQSIAYLREQIRKLSAQQRAGETGSLRQFRVMSSARKE
jgi:hypothetical protein